MAGEQSGLLFFLTPGSFSWKRSDIEEFYVTSKLLKFYFYSLTIRIEITGRQLGANEKLLFL